MAKFITNVIFLHCRHKFVSLQAMVKTVLIRIAALLVLIWYSLGIIGFDVHTCDISGRSFIAVFVEGTTCQDIHPEHGCCHDHHECSCCHDEEDAFCLDTQDKCCTDEYQMLSVTGTFSDYTRDFALYGNLAFRCSAFCGYEAQVHGMKMKSGLIMRPGSGQMLPDVQTVLSVWRI